MQKLQCPCDLHVPFIVGGLWHLPDCLPGCPPARPPDTIFPRTMHALATYSPHSPSGTVFDAVNYLKTHDFDGESMFTWNFHGTSRDDPEIVFEFWTLLRTRSLYAWITDAKFRWPFLSSEIPLKIPPPIVSVSIRTHGKWVYEAGHEEAAEAMENMACQFLLAKEGLGVEEFAYDSPEVANRVDDAIARAKPHHVAYVSRWMGSLPRVLHDELRSLWVSGVLAERDVRLLISHPATCLEEFGGVNVLFDLSQLCQLIQRPGLRRLSIRGTLSSSHPAVCGPASHGLVFLEIRSSSCISRDLPGILPRHNLCVFKTNMGISPTLWAQLVRPKTLRELDVLVVPDDANGMREVCTNPIERLSVCRISPKQIEVLLATEASHPLRVPGAVSVSHPSPEWLAVDKQPESKHPWLPMCCVSPH